MLRWLGLWRPIVGRARSDWQFLVAIWLLIASAVTLVTAGTLYAETVEVGGLRRALTDAPVASQAVSVRTQAPAARVDEIDAAVRPVISDTFGASGAEVVLTLRSTSLRPAGEIEGPASEQLTVLGAYPDIERHAELLEGSWPTPGTTPMQAALSADAAEAMGLAVGDTYALADAASATADPNVVVVEVVVVGLFEPDARDPYWLGNTLELAGSEGSSIRYRGPLVVAQDDLLGGERFSQLELRWRALPNVDRLRVEQLPGLAARIRNLPARVEGALPTDRSADVTTELAGVLGGIDRSALVSRSGVVLTTLQFGVVAGYAVVLVGAMLLERRRSEMALLRARGATTGEVALIAFGEAALVAVPAAIVAPLIAVLLVSLLSTWGLLAESGIVGVPHVSEAVLLVAALGGLACVVAMTLPALVSQLDLARVRAALGRPLAQTAAQRLGLDIVLLILAAIGLYQLQEYGAPLTRGSAGGLALDPLLVAAPAIALAAAAVLVVRLVPRAGEIAEWLTRRRRGMVLPLSARGLARRPLRYTRAALLIVLAAALGAFGAIYASTWSQSQADQATFQAGADIRLTLDRTNDFNPETVGATLGEVDGVEATTPLVRELIDVGRLIRRSPLLALSPEGVAGLGEGPATDPRTSAVLAQLAERRVPLPAIELNAEARRLAVVLDTTLENLHPDTIVGDLRDWPGIRVEPVIQLADGTVVTLAEQTAIFFADEQRIVFELPAAAEAAAATRLIEVQLRIFTPSVTVGNVLVDRIEDSPAADGEEWRSVLETGTLTEAEIFLDAGPQDFVFEGSTIVNTPQDPLFPFNEPQPIFRWQPFGALSPSLVGVATSAFLEATGSQVGDTVEIDFYFQRVPTEIIAEVPSFPTTNPDEPLLIADRQSLNVLRHVLTLAPPQSIEWWLAVEDGRSAEVSEALRASDMPIGQLINRTALASALERDPIALGMVGALALGSIAAGALAIIAFIVTAVLAAREQLDEYALLRALGMSRRQVTGWLVFDHVFLLAAGVLAGGAIGTLIAALVVPHATLTAAGVPVVPPPVLVVPWDAFALLAGVVPAVLLVLSVLLAARQISRRSVTDVLREQEV